MGQARFMFVLQCLDIKGCTALQQVPDSSNMTLPSQHELPVREDVAPGQLSSSGSWTDQSEDV
jgi:hypothetical protein